MKIIFRITLALYFVLITSYLATAQVGINSDGASPDASAMLDVTSDSKGILIPRMDSTARNNISSPATGLMVYDTTTISFWYFDDNQWNEIRNGNTQLTATDFIDSLPDEICLNITGNLGIGNNPKFVVVSGSYAYVTDEVSNDLKVIDISDPATPTLSGSLVIGDNPTSVAISGNYAYVVDYTSNDLKVIDISDPTTPTLSGNYVTGDYFTSVTVSGNYAYATDLNSGYLIIFDVSDPTNPIKVGDLNIGSLPNFVAVSGNYAYVIDRGSDDLKVIDVSDPTNPIISNSLAIGGYPRSMALSGNYIYVVDLNTDDLKVIDISAPTVPILSSSLTVGTSPRSVVLSGNYAYVVDAETDDLKVIDVSDPTNPILSNSLAIGSSPRCVAISEGYAYVVDAHNYDLKVIQIFCEDELLTFDVSSGTFESTSFTDLQDDLGNHTATQNISLSNYWLSNDGDDEGITIDNNGNVGINGNYTFPTDDGSANQLLTTDGIGSLSWSTLTQDILSDADADTKIQVEESSDEDIIRFDLGGTEYMQLNTSELNVNGNVAFGTSGLYQIDEGSWKGANITLASGDGTFGFHSSGGVLDVYIDGSLNTKEGLTIGDGSTYTFPTADGSANQFLITDGSGSLSWTDIDENLGNHTATQNVVLDDNWISNDGGNEGIKITDDGNVGVGTTPTNGKFEVNGSIDNVINNYAYLNNSNSNTNYVSSNTSDKAVSIYASDRIVGKFVISMSDERIKDIKGLSDNKADLDILTQIEITDYEFKDKVKEGDTKQKKVIAQQVAKVFPQAINNQFTEVIPNIYKTATIDENGWVSFNGQLIIDNGQLKTGDKVQIIFDDEKELLEVLETKPNAFRVQPITNHQSPITIFVYGTQVDDFHTVDYEAISMLNVSATQQLAKENEQLKKRITELEKLEQEVKQLKVQVSKVNELEAMLQQLQAQLSNNQ